MKNKTVRLWVDVDRCAACGLANPTIWLYNFHPTAGWGGVCIECSRLIMRAAAVAIHRQLSMNLESQFSGTN